jgi:WhiB family redox-sensing transcriptional regulator
MTNTEWMNEGACKGNQEMFFDETHLKVVRAAREICASCVVKFQCLDHAIANKEVGVWAGTTTNERAKLMRKSKKESAKVQTTVSSL